MPQRLVHFISTLQGTGQFSHSVPNGKSSLAYNSRKRIPLLANLVPIQLVCLSLFIYIIHILIIGAETSNPGVTQKPDNPLNGIWNPVPRKRDNPLKYI